MLGPERVRARTRERVLGPEQVRARAPEREQVRVQALGQAPEPEQLRVQVQGLGQAPERERARVRVRGSAPWLVPARAQVRALERELEQASEQVPARGQGREPMLAARQEPAPEPEQLRTGMPELESHPEPGLGSALTLVEALVRAARVQEAQVTRAKSPLLQSRELDRSRRAPRSPPARSSPRPAPVRWVAPQKQRLDPRFPARRTAEAAHMRVSHRLCRLERTRTSPRPHGLRERRQTRWRGGWLQKRTPSSRARPAGARTLRWSRPRLSPLRPGPRRFQPLP